MGPTSRTQHRVEHNADRRVRELYRYYQPASLRTAVPSWIPAGEALPPTSNTGEVNTPPASDDTGSSGGTAASRPSTTIGPDALVVGASNSTLTSFAQLAALRLNVERALICVLDRDMHYVLADATKSVNLNGTENHGEKDRPWLGTTGGQRAWSICQVSPLPAYLLQTNLPPTNQHSDCL